ncbi:MAG: deoxyribonuclease IV [bacterium]|nr:deoxyribonuclease IV [bacterium]
MKLGAHMSIAGGFAEALSRVHAIGGTSVQMFSGSPRGWSKPQASKEQAEEFQKRAKAFGMLSSYFHASYLINLADDGYIGTQSVSTLIAELTAASVLGVKGSIIHLGSFKDAEKVKSSKLKVPSLFESKKESMPAYVKHPKYELLIKNIKDILEKTPENTFFIIENAGTRKIGRTLEEIASIVSNVNSQRLKVCLDTCHLHAAGYDLRSPKKLQEFLEEFDRAVGLSRLEVFHLNDSRDAFGSLADRHQNIGEGAVGKEVFKGILNHPKLKHLSFIIETPGFDDRGPDKKNLDILKSMIK